MTGGIALGCDDLVSKPAGKIAPEAVAARDDGDPKKEERPVSEYVFKPSDVAGRKSGLEIVVKADDVKDREGFFLEFYALKPKTTSQGEPSVEKIPLGGTTIFKPLATGDSLTAVLEAPPKAAWVKTTAGEELRVGFEVKAGHPERRVPKIDLHIVEVKESPEE